MIIENTLSKIVQDRKLDGLVTMLEYNEQNLLEDPKSVAWCDFAKQIRIKFDQVDDRVHKYKFYRFLRF